MTAENTPPQPVPSSEGNDAPESVRIRIEPLIDMEIEAKGMPVGKREDPSQTFLDPGITVNETTQNLTVPSHLFGELRPEVRIAKQIERC